MQGTGNGWSFPPHFLRRRGERTRHLPRAAGAPPCCLRERALAGTAPGTERAQSRAQAPAEALPALFPPYQHSFPLFSLGGCRSPHPRGQPHLWARGLALSVLKDILLSSLWIINFLRVYSHQAKMSSPFSLQTSGTETTDLLPQGSFQLPL